MYEIMTKVRQPRYSCECMLFNHFGNARVSFELKGCTAGEIVDQFLKTQSVENEHGWHAYLPREILALAQAES